VSLCLQYLGDAELSEPVARTATAVLVSASRVLLDYSLVQTRPAALDERLTELRGLVRQVARSLISDRNPHRSRAVNAKALYCRLWHETPEQALQAYREVFTGDPEATPTELGMRTRVCLGHGIGGKEIGRWLINHRHSDSTLPAPREGGKETTRKKRLHLGSQWHTLGRFSALEAGEP
jgi:hypothetical protein